MPDVGGLEVLLFLVLVYGSVAFALYWIIRLAVRHGIEDGRQVDRARASAAEVSATIRRQRATYDGPEPD